MGATEVVQLIQTVGFPIVACLLLGYWLKYREDKNSEFVSNTLESVRQAIENNTMVLTKLIAKMGADEDEDEDKKGGN